MFFENRYSEKVEVLYGNVKIILRGAISQKNEEKIGRSK